MRTSLQTSQILNPALICLHSFFFNNFLWHLSHLTMFNDECFYQCWGSGPEADPHVLCLQDPDPIVRFMDPDPFLFSQRC
jgi:hypothetical protein